MSLHAGVNLEPYLLRQEAFIAATLDQYSQQACCIVNSLLFSQVFILFDPSYYNCMFSCKADCSVLVDPALICLWVVIAVLVQGVYGLHKKHGRELLSPP